MKSHDVLTRVSKSLQGVSTVEEASAALKAASFGIASVNVRRIQRMLLLLDTVEEHLVSHALQEMAESGSAEEVLSLYQMLSRETALTGKQIADTIKSLEQVEPAPLIPTTGTLSAAPLDTVSEEARALLRDL